MKIYKKYIEVYPSPSNFCSQPNPKKTIFRKNLLIIQEKKQQIFFYLKLKKFFLCLMLLLLCLLSDIYLFFRLRK